MNRMTSDSTVLLGPIVRYVGTETATLWFEMAESANITVVTDADVRGSERTWGVHGHHYALVPLEGLPANATVHYEVFVDERRVWPPEVGRPPSTPSMPMDPSRWPSGRVGGVTTTATNR